MKLSLNISISFYTVFTNCSVAVLSSILFNGMGLESKINFTPCIRNVCTEDSLAIRVCDILVVILQSQIMRRIVFAIAYTFLLHGTKSIHESQDFYTKNRNIHA